MMVCEKLSTDLLVLQQIVTTGSNRSVGINQQIYWCNLVDFNNCNLWKIGNKSVSVAVDIALDDDTTGNNRLATDLLI